MAVERQAAALPPPQPVYILRGHVAQIHSVQFARQNSRLLTGDADGWVVFWKVETKRALAVWNAHQGAILGTGEWGCDKIITHGRDNNLRIWQLRPSDETALSNVLPAEPTDNQRPKPWLLHTLPVNTLNFCAFSMCYARAIKHEEPTPPARSIEGTTSPNSYKEAILIAVPARDDKKIEIYQFPDEKLRFVVPRLPSTETGMVMAVKLVYSLTSQDLLVLAGYEGGFTTVHKLPQNNISSALDLAELVYLSQPHTQPILSLDVLPDARVFFTSSADAILAAHRIPELPAEAQDGDTPAPKEEDENRVTTSDIDQTQSSGSSPVLKQKGIDAVEPFDPPSEPLDFSKKPLPSNSTNSSLSFSKTTIPMSRTESPKPGGLSSLLSSAASKSNGQTAQSQPPPTVTLQPAHKTINTKHAGQQSLCVRSDGRLLATGGWDKRIRIYSSKTLKEVAVLKWHKEGVYAVAFSKILRKEDLDRHDSQDSDDIKEVIRRETALAKLQRQREEAIQLKHWVVAGAKDGKVSLWEVF